jgi:hypothetical protein
LLRVEGQRGDDDRLPVRKAIRVDVPGIDDYLEGVRAVDLLLKPGKRR